MAEISRSLVDNASDRTSAGAAAVRRLAGLGDTAPPTVLHRARHATGPRLRATVERLHPDLALIAGYHMGWYDQAGNTVAHNGGKGVCLALTLLAAEATGGSVDEAVPGAVAVELVHVFTHLHDDIMDDDRRRRGRASAWQAFGIGPAILSGDALFAVSLQTVAEARNPHALAATQKLLQMCAQLGHGQAEDLRCEQLPLHGPDSVDVPTYMAMAAGKTGAVYSGALAVGAILAGASAEVVGRLASAGRALGLMAQIVDDINGLWGDPRATGKPVGADLRRRKKTLPIIAALSSASRDGRRLAELLSCPPSTSDDIGILTELVAGAGGLASSVAEADQQHRTALSYLDQVPIPVATRAELRALADFIRHRHA